MKVLLLLIILTSCTKEYCSVNEYRDYRYGDKVTKIHVPFYKNATGVILNRSRVMSNGCVTKSFVVRLDAYKDLPEKDVNISQYSLFVKEL